MRFRRFIASGRGSVILPTVILNGETYRQSVESVKATQTNPSKQGSVPFCYDSSIISSTRMVAPAAAWGDIVVFAFLFLACDSPFHTVSAGWLLFLRSFSFAIRPISPPPPSTARVVVVVVVA